jgi:TPR repeat protein
VKTFGYRMPVERRSQSRHRINTPAYASILGHSGGVITDAHDNGIAIQGVTPLPTGSAVAMRLDLLETRSIVEADGRVTWSDELGRSGLEFRDLSPEALGRIQQWLLVNALSLWATTPERNGAVEQGQGAGEDQRRSARALNEQLGEAVANALSATGAEGAALALITGTEAVCLAAAGELAPPVGSHLDSRNGLSGACLRTGRLMRCDHAATDARVDAETCRELGISSVAAAPILIGGEVAGLLEIFSSLSHAFDEEHCSTLQAVTASVAMALQSQASAPQAAPAAPFDTKLPAEVPAAEEETASAAAMPDSAPAPSVPPSPAVGATSSVSSAAAWYAADPPARIADGTRVAAITAADRGVAASRAISMQRGAEETAEETEAVNPGLLRSEFGVLPDEEQESRGKGRNRWLLLAPIAVLLLVGVGFLAVRGGMNAKNGPATTVVTENPQQPATPPRPNTNTSLAGLKTEAERGDANSQFDLGAKYASGDGVPQNYNQAVKWFTKAAEQGHVLSAATLGAFYWAGRGVGQDYVSAYMWSAVARQGGDEASKYRVAILGARMTPDQVNEAQSRATDWLRQHPHFTQASKASTAPVQ